MTVVPVVTPRARARKNLFIKLEPLGGGAVQIAYAPRAALNDRGDLVLSDARGRTRNRIKLDQVRILQILWVSCGGGSAEPASAA